MKCNLLITELFAVVDNCDVNMIPSFLFGHRIVRNISVVRSPTRQVFTWFIVQQWVIKCRECRLHNLVPKLPHLGRTNMILMELKRITFYITLIQQSLAQGQQQQFILPNKFRICWHNIIVFCSVWLSAGVRGSEPWACEGQYGSSRYKIPHPNHNTQR